MLNKAINVKKKKNIFKFVKFILFFKEFEEYDLSGALHTLQTFFLNDFCDVFIESSKQNLQDGVKKKN